MGDCCGAERDEGPGSVAVCDVPVEAVAGREDRGVEDNFRRDTLLLSVLLLLLFDEFELQRVK